MRIKVTFNYFLLKARKLQKQILKMNVLCKYDKHLILTKEMK